MHKFGLIVAAITIGFTGASAETGITSITGQVVYPNPDNQRYSLGWSFRTSGETIAALGYNDYGFSSAHSVGVYNSLGSLLASTSVTAGSTLLNGYRYNDLASALTLTAGTYYIVGTTGGRNDGYTYLAASFNTNAATTYLGSYYSGVTDNLVFPTNASTAQYLEVNFSTTAVGATPSAPEPASWALMILGFGAVGVAMRRRKVSIRFA